MIRFLLSLFNNYGKKVQATEYKKQGWDKVREELNEFEEEEKKVNKEKMESEFGDMMFAVINLESSIKKHSEF